MIYIAINISENYMYVDKNGISNQTQYSKLYKYNIDICVYNAIILKTEEQLKEAVFRELCKIRNMHCPYCKDVNNFYQTVLSDEKICRKCGNRIFFPIKLYNTNIGSLRCINIC